MSEELGFIETWWWAEGWSEVSEADLSRVREDGKAAAGMRAQIVKSWKKNRQYAKLLSLLLMYVESEKLLTIIFRQLVDQKLPVEVIVWEFLPFLHARVDVSPLQPLYSSVWDNATTPRMSKRELEDYYRDVRTLFDIEFIQENVEELITIMTKELRIPVPKEVVDGGK